MLPADEARYVGVDLAWGQRNRTGLAVLDSTGRRVCIEVYPHPAMVSLFPLDYVIPYKIKPGRDLPALTVAYRRLLDHLEGTCGAVLRLGDYATGYIVTPTPPPPTAVAGRPVRRTG
jgi:predicted RNase H-like nuclease